MPKKDDGASLSSKKIKDIWTKLTPTDWLGVLQEYRPNNLWELRGKEIKGLCPFHDEKTPSFSVFPERGFAVCFGASCSNKYTWSPIRLLAHLIGGGQAAALKLLRERFAIQVSAKVAENAQLLEDHGSMKLALLAALNAEFVKTINTPSDPDILYTQETDLVPWFRERQFPDSTAHVWPVGVVPTVSRLFAQLDAVGAEKYRNDAFEYLKSYIATPGTPAAKEGCLVYFCFDSPNSVGRVKIRVPRESRYYVVNDDVSSNVGFFGLNMYNHLLGRGQDLPVYVVEGEMDALSIITHQRALGRDDMCIVSNGGSMVNEIDVLTDFGFSEIVLIPDNDPQGIGWAFNLLNHNSNIRRIFNWTANDLGVKDVDEAVRAYGFQAFVTRLKDPASYSLVHEWAIAQADAEISKVEGGDVRAMMDIAIRRGISLKVETDRLVYVDTLSKLHGLNRENILQGMIPADSPQSMIYPIKAHILDKIFDVIGFNEGRMPALKVWSKRRRHVTNIVVDKNTIDTQLSPELGILEEYTKNNIGWPDFMDHTVDTKGRPMPLSLSQKRERINTIYFQAFASVMNSADKISTMKAFGSGLHITSSEPEGKDDTIFIVNGSNVFKGAIGESGVDYTLLPTPVHKGIVFNGSNDPAWSTNLRCENDILDGRNYDPKELFDRLLDIYSCWQFQNQELDPVFLAADTLYTPIAAVFNMMVCVDVCGESQSGKTTLIQLMGGREHREYRLCEPTRLYDGYTAASIRMEMTDIRLRLFLDEFEEADGQSDAKANYVRDVLENIRGLSTGGTIARGNSDGQTRKYSLFFPLTVTGIYTMKKVQDLNRFIHIRTRAVKGYNDPMDTIRKRISVEEIQRIRRGITLCFLQRIPEIQAAYNEVRSEFSDNMSITKGMQTRLKENLLPGVAILKYVGYDYVKYIKEISEAKLAEMQERGITEEGEGVWQALLNTAIKIRRPEAPDIQAMSVSKILRAGERVAEEIFSYNEIGVHYVREKKWLIVYWKEALNNILRSDAAYRTATDPGKIKASADSYSRTVRRFAPGTYAGLTKFFGRTVKLSDISVLDVSHLVDDVANERAIVDLEVRQAIDDDIPGIVRGEF